MNNTEMTAKIMKILRDYFENEENIRLWLNFPHPDLGNETPQELIDAGRAEVVLDMLEAAKMGVTS